MRDYDFTPLTRSFIGFDRMARMIDAASKAETTGGYPPYNIEQVEENAYRIELAVAGFSEDELEIVAHQNVLTVTGQKTEDDRGRTYVHRGIAGRGFERRFQLADHVVVTGADLKNGLLIVDLRREVPDALKPRTIAIGAQNLSAPVANDKNLTGSKPSKKVKAA